MLFQFLAHSDRGVRVPIIPLADLVSAIEPGVDLVAVSRCAMGTLGVAGLRRIEDR